MLPHLRVNLETNAPCPFEIAPFAVAGKSGRMRARADSGTDNAGAIAYEPADAGEDGVDCLSLRDLRALYGNYDVLKLDIEGMEDEAIRGDAAFMSERRRSSGPNAMKICKASSCSRP